MHSFSVVFQICPATPANIAFANKFMNAKGSENYSAANYVSVPLHSNLMLIKMGQIKTYANKIIIIPQL